MANEVEAVTQHYEQQAERGDALGLPLGTARTDVRREPHARKKLRTAAQDDQLGLV